MNVGRSRGMLEGGELLYGQGEEADVGRHAQSGAGRGEGGEDVGENLGGKVEL